jgi:hypothetical protein
MGSDIEMDKSSRAYLQHIHDPKADANRDEEITSQHGLGMIVDEGHPALGWNRLPSAARRLLQQILLDSSRGHLNSQLQHELGRNTRLPPGRIVSGYSQNQLTKIFGNPRSADGSGFPPPEQSKPWRCHPVKVAGRTEIKASFQSNSLAAKTMVSRVASVARRGRT